MIRTVYALVILLTAVWIAGCSTTKRLTDDEVLYTGVRKIEIKPDSGVSVNHNVISAVEEPLSVPPNNPLYSPYLRTPFPTGLWAYNYLYTSKEKGFRSWLYRKLSKKPVLISTVQPELRVNYVADILKGFGYFDTQVSYKLLPAKRNLKKEKINYTVRIGPASFLSSIRFPKVEPQMQPLADSLFATSLLREGMQYNLDTLSAERNRITNVLRNRGFYYFQPDFIKYQADTLLKKYRVALRMNIQTGLPASVLRKYSVGRIIVRLSNIQGGEIDTLHLQNCDVIYQKPLKIRPKLLSESITLKSGEVFSLKSLNQTQTLFNRLGVFSSVGIDIIPIDSVGKSDSLNVNLSAKFDYPLQAELQTNVSAKSNSFIGPGLVFKVSNNNLFRGGEMLSLGLKANYEWQTGGNKNAQARASLLNSYEFGLDASLSFQRLWMPRFITRRLDEFPGRTSIRLGANLLNRPRFFQMLSIDGSIGYDFQSSPYSFHTLTLVRLVYNNLLSTTAEFDQAMRQNPAIALSFRNQFIPSSSYMYTYDRLFRKHRLVFQNTFTPAGNLLYGIWELFGQHGEKQLFNNPFSQFVKNISEVKYYQKVGKKNNWLVYRLLVGAGLAYGNSSVMPYSEQFYIGGANSIRAFTVRSLGPGSYRPDQGDLTGYLDQTGDFKLEANIEFRFALIKKLYGAIFLDAGNIWLLKNDPKRPGGELSLRNFFNDIALGTGFGLRYDLTFLVIRADLGIAIHTPYPNPDKPGYYNISSFKNGLGFHLALGYPF